jgi:hypothetical protein
MDEPASPGRLRKLLNESTLLGELWQSDGPQMQHCFRYAQQGDRHYSFINERRSQRNPCRSPPIDTWATSPLKNVAKSLLYFEKALSEMRRVAFYVKAPGEPWSLGHAAKPTLMKGICLASRTDSVHVTHLSENCVNPLYNH